jgi:PAS domain S-box-containing protein
MTIFPVQVRKARIQTRLITYYVVFALVTVTLMAYFAYAQAARSLRSSVEDKLTTVAELKVDFLKQWVDQEQRNAVLFASLPELRQLSGVLLAPDSSVTARDHARTELTRLVTLIAQRTNEFQDVQILDPDGQIVISAFAPNLGRSQFGQPFFIEGQTRTFVQPFSRSELFGRTTLIVATPLFDLNDQRVGVFALHLNMRHIDGIIQEDELLSAAVQSYLVTPARVVITEDPILLERLPEFNSPAVDMALAQQEGIASYTNHAGADVIGLYKWLEQQNAILVVEIDETVALAPARRLALIIMIGGLILSILLVFIVTFLARRITAPLLALTDTASNIANGKLDALAPVLSNDEVGTLAQAFNSMTEKLRHTLVGLQAELHERQQAEQVLKRNEQEMRLTNELLRTIMDSPRGVIIFSLDREYRYTTFTQTHFETMRLIWGVTIEIGMNMLECIHDPADREKARANFDRALEGEYFTLQEEYGDQALQRTWWENRYSPIMDEANRITGLTVVVIDITERKRMESALRDSEEKFRKVFHSSPVATCITTLEEGRLLEANYAYWDLTGYDPDNSIGKNADELKMWDDPAERGKFVLDLQTKRSLFNPDDYFSHTDGSIRYVISFYELIQVGDEACVLAMFYDMSVQKKTVQALQQSEARTRALLEALPDMIMEVDAKGGIVNLVPPKGMAEMPLNNFEGRSLQELLPDAIIPQVLEAVAGALEAGRLTVLEFDAIMASELHTMEARVAPGTRNSAIIIVRDITERKWMEAERERFIAELELRNRESETLRTSLASIVETFNFDEIIRRILAQIQLVIPYDTASVWQVNGEAMHIIYGVGLPPEIEIPGTVMKIDEHNSAMPILRGGAPYILNNNVQAELMDFTEPPHNYVESWLAIPLRTRGQVIGQIALDGRRKGQFNTHHAELAVTFANQVAIALDNVSLFDGLQGELARREDLIRELEAKNAETETMRESLASIVGTFELTEIVQQILDQIRRVVPYDSASVWRLVGNTQILIGERDLPSEIATVGLHFELDEANHAMPLFKGEQPYLISHDVQSEFVRFQVPPHTYINSWLGVPLRVRERVIGLIALDGKQRSQFNERHARLAVTFADQVAIALENARLFSDLQDELKKQIALRSASIAISSSLHLDQVLEEICKQMCMILDGTSSYIAEYDRAYASYKVVAEYIASSANTAEQVSDLGVQYIRESGAVMFEPATDADHLVTYAGEEDLSVWSQTILTTYHGKTILHIPLYVQGRLLGHAELWDSRTRREFTREEISFCRAVSQQAALAIANASLFEQLQTELGERKTLIAELEAKNAELERFTYTVSHDLKSPLFTIRGFLGFLEQDALDGNQVRIKADVQRITDAAEKMHALLNDLLELSRIGRLKNESVAVSFEELVHEAVDLVHGRIMAQGISIHVDAGLPAVFGDRQRLVEVVQNLVDNAAKFMGNQPAPRIEIGQHGMQHGRPVLFVRDNGIGVAPEHYERIFGLFNKLDVKSDGTGIGLALVKRIIEVHGGHIWVESRIGYGSTFFFTLPLAPDG